MKIPRKLKSQKTRPHLQFLPRPRRSPKPISPPIAHQPHPNSTPPPPSKLTTSPPTSKMTQACSKKSSISPSAPPTMASMTTTPQRTRPPTTKPQIPRKTLHKIKNQKRKQKTMYHQPESSATPPLPPPPFVTTARKARRSQNPKPPEAHHQSQDTTDNLKWKERPPSSKFPSNPVATRILQPSATAGREPQITATSGQAPTAGPEAITTGGAAAQDAPQTLALLSGILLHKCPRTWHSTKGTPPHTAPRPPSPSTPREPLQPLSHLHQIPQPTTTTKRVAPPHRGLKRTRTLCLLTCLQPRTPAMQATLRTTATNFPAILQPTNLRPPSTRPPASSDLTTNTSYVCTTSDYAWFTP